MEVKLCILRLLLASAPWIEPAAELAARITSSREGETETQNRLQIAEVLIEHLTHHPGGLRRPLKAASEAGSLWGVKLILSVQDGIIAAARSLFSRSAPPEAVDAPMEAFLM